MTDHPSVAGERAELEPDGGRRRTLTASLLALLVVVAAAYGLSAPDAYPSVTELQRQTWRAQDALNLALAALLVVTARSSASGSLRMRLVHVGLMGWFAYCYLHLAFGAVFNSMFLAYVGAAALATFGFLNASLRVDPETSPAAPALPRRGTAVFLAVSALGIGGLWLSEIVPGVLGLAAPPNLHLGGLPNPTWVLDLGWLIPWALATAWQLWRQHPAAQPRAVALLVLLAALSLAMLLVEPFGLAAGLGGDPTATSQLVVFTAVFGVLGAIEGVLLARAMGHPWRVRRRRGHGCDGQGRPGSPFWRAGCS